MAAEFGLSIVSSIANLLVEPTRRQLGYMFCFKSFVQELGEQKQKLALAQDRVQNDVEAAKANGDEIMKDVEKWMEDAEKIMTDVTLLESKIRDDKKCFAGWCPKLHQQYKLSKEMEGKTTMLKKLENETNSIKFQRVGGKAHLQNIDFLPSKEFIPLNSSKEALKVIMGALKDDKVNMIGLCGMGGVGKTTLVKQLGRKAKELQLFDEVLMVVVSQTPDLTRIQDRLAENLGLSTLKETKEGKAERLLHRLQSEEKVLIILDDVWDYLGTEDLRNMGIPFDDDLKNKGWKILLTTRLHNVCTSMDCQKKIFLELLPENDAWDLFKTKANLRDEDYALNNVAKKVAKECKGLPIAIVVVGTTLRGKRTVQEWQVALRQLKTLLKDIKHTEREKNVYACLEMSYDYLNKDTKICLLLCSLFPEDYEIPIEDLIRYAIGKGLCNDDQSMEEARDQVFVAIKDLKDSCLLLEASKRDHVKMHDLVREVAIQVASQGEHVFLVKAGIGLKEWPTNIKSFENFTAISLMGNDITQLPKGLVCPRLKILMLGRAEYGYHNAMVVPEKFFEGMEALEVLSLKGASLSLQALELLVNLEFLELVGCECEDITSLRKLQKLKILSFCWSDVKELPNEIGELKKLKSLDLTRCWDLKTIPRNLIERFGNLEELYATCFKNWGVVGRDTQITNAGLADLNSLPKLTALSLIIPKVETIPADFAFPGQLHRYMIALGEESLTRVSSELPTSRKLIFRFDRFTYFNAKPFKQLFPTVCDLELLFVEGYKNIIPEMAEGSLENLVDLNANYCLGMECLVDTTQQLQHMSITAFSNLKDTHILHMGSLRELCKGRPPMGFLHKLKAIDVRYCPVICTLFPAKLWQALQNVETVAIGDCKELEEVFELDEVLDEANEVLLLSRLTTLKLNDLWAIKFIWKGPTQQVSLQNLNHLRLDTCAHLTSIFTLSLAQSLLRLETLAIVNCYELEHIIREKENDDGKEQTIPQPLCFPKLTTISIHRCRKLEYVFPVSVAPSLSHLEKLSISAARQLTRIFDSNGEGDALAADGDGTLVFPRLRELRLLYVPRLSFCGPKSFAVKLPSLQHLEITDYKTLSNVQAFTNLKELKIRGYEDEHQLRGIWNCLTLENLTALEVSTCYELKNVFPTSIARSLVQMKSLKISWCVNLEEIIARPNEDEKDAIVLESHLPSLCFPNLCEIEVSHCNKLKRLFPVIISAGLPQLKSLKISSCDELEEIITKDNGDENDAIVLESHLPSLCFPNLCEVEVSYCKKLKSLFPVTIAAGLPQLKSLKISLCHELKGIFARDNEDEKDAIVLRSHLPSLCFPNLHEIEVSSCKKLKNLFPVTIAAGGLPQLKSLKISSCHELEEIIARDNEDEKDTIVLRSHLPSLCLPNLCEINVKWCNKLKSLFPVTIAAGLPQLKSLIISSCTELKEIIASDNANEKDALEKLKVQETSELMEGFGPEDEAAGINVEKQIVVPNLVELSLHYLPELVYFCPPNYHVIIPRKVTLKLIGCFKMNTTFATRPDGGFIAKSKAPEEAQRGLE